jgi:allantoicase
MFFGPKDNIILPGRAANMGEGWETRRRRGPGNDWIIIKLGARGIIKKLEIDTNHFKGNYPDRCSLDGAMVTDPALRAEDFTDPAKCTWKEIMSETKLKGHTRHFIEKDIVSHGPLTHVRLNIFPDGGVSRLRAFGSLS